MEENKKKLKVLVVGGGMFVSGKGTDSYGTILPALNELYREGIVGDVCVAVTSLKSIQELKRKLSLLRKKTGTNLRIMGVPRKGKNLQAYKEAISLYKPDCAIVVVPDHLHYKIALDLIKADIHALVVKPLAPTINEAKKLIKLVKRKNVYGAVEFHKRFDEANLKLKEMVIDGRLGDILYAHVEYSQQRSIPLKIFKNWVKQTNIFQYLGVHYVDIIYFVTGAKPIRVLGVGQKRLLRKHGINNYDSIQVLIEWGDSKNNRFISSILTNWIDPNTTSAISDQKIMMVGTKGRFESDQKNRGVRLITETGGIEDINPYFTQSYPSYEKGRKIFKGYGIKSVRQFCKDVLNIKNGLNKPLDFEGTRPTFKDALVSTAVIEAANKSLRNNSWVDIKIK